MLGPAISQYSNVSFLDFYSEPDPRLGNEKFYDIQHLNRGGAEVFTQILIDGIRRDIEAHGVAVRRAEQHREAR